MIKEVIATGRTVDAAIDSGCEELGKDRGDVDFEIISMPRKGFLGLSQSPAKVRVYFELPDPVAPAAPVEKTSPKPQAPHREPVAAPIKAVEPSKAAVIPAGIPSQPCAEPKEAPAEPCNFGNKVAVAEEYVSTVLKAMGLSEVEITSSTRDNVILLKLTGDVSGVAIGRHGETLDALQYLAGLAANRGDGDYTRVVLDSGNYRDKRRITLEQLAQKLGNAVIKTGRSTTLEPMNPYERRIIHSTISEMEGVVSSSVGEEPNRCVVISSTNPVEAPPHEARVPRPAGDRAPRPPYREGGDRGPRPPRRDGDRGPRRDGRDDRRGGPHRDKPAPYQESSRREVAPTEGENQPLYGKIEL